MQYINSVAVSENVVKIPIFELNDLMSEYRVQGIAESTSFSDVEALNGVRVQTLSIQGVTEKEGVRPQILEKMVQYNKGANNIDLRFNLSKYFFAYYNEGWSGVARPILIERNQIELAGYDENDLRKFAGILRYTGSVDRMEGLIAIHYKYSDIDWYKIQGVGVDGDFLNATGSFINFNSFSDGLEIIEVSEEYGAYSESGGYGGGSFDDSSDAFGLPSLPSLGVSEVGFINVYNPSKGQLQGFADELFPDFEMPTPSTATGIEAVAENLANTFQVLGDFAESYVNAGLINYVIDCHIVPVAPVTNGTSSIKVGFKTFNYLPAKVTSDYVAFDCGSLEIAEYYQNFLDYEGTKAKLYLPFIGFVDIKPEWFQSGKLGVTYHFNIIDGSCIAFVIATSSKSNLKNTVVATFGGNCCVHMPITGVNYSSMISGVVGGAVGIASNASNMIKTNRADKGTVMSNIEGATGIASNLADAVGAKPSIEQSNGYNAGMSFMCYRRPYLLIERPVASFSKNYPSEQGLPLNVTKKLGSMKGFTTCTAPVVDNFHCLEEEKEMIKQALIEGIIF